MDSFEYHVTFLMPNKFYPDDEKWIREMLQCLDPATRGKIAIKYAEIYQEYWDLEPISYKQDNRARNQANTRLREFVRKYAAYSQGKVSTPELLQECPNQNNQPMPRAA